MDILYNSYNIRTTETDGVCGGIMFHMVDYRKNVVAFCAIVYNSDNCLETADTVGIFGNILFTDIGGFSYLVCKFRKVNGYYFSIFQFTCKLE